MTNRGGRQPWIWGDEVEPSAAYLALEEAREASMLAFAAWVETRAGQGLVCRHCGHDVDLSGRVCTCMTGAAGWVQGDAAELGLEGMTDGEKEAYRREHAAEWQAVAEQVRSDRGQAGREQWYGEETWPAWQAGYKQGWKDRQEKVRQVSR